MKRSLNNGKLNLRIVKNLHTLRVAILTTLLVAANEAKCRLHQIRALLYVF